MDSESDAMDGHGLLLAFDTDDPEFARGFEAGRVWCALQLQPGEGQPVVVHVANAEMVLRMAEATGRSVQGEESEDGVWFTVSFEAAEEEILPE